MKVIAFFLALLAMFIFGACRPSAAPISVGNQAVSINDVPQPGVPSKPVEQMSWTQFDGRKHKLQDLRGKAVILDFWATYCKPCLEEIPHLKELQAKYGAENLQIVGLHVGGEEDEPKVPEFVERLKIDYQLGDPEPALTSYIFGRQTAIPQTAVFDRKGQLVKKIIGFNDEIRAELDAAVVQAMNN
ncbi:MAG: TlpA disulfide reductase family protein [Pyrinomonadaceae bacterium]